MTLPKKVNILLLGGGGREHAIARSLAASPRCGKLYIAPGNAGTATVGTNVEMEATNFGVIKQFVLNHGVGLVVVGPEEPLTVGIVDFFESDAELKFVPVAGPSEAGARLEGSKDFAKAFMVRHGIPTAAYRTFGKGGADAGAEFLETLKPPYVLKADGLAAGKGVVIPETLDEAKEQLADMLGGRFGKAGSRVVIEEYLRGIECSVFVATDGTNYKILPVAKDYKRIGEGDTGPNTGGMGAVSPVPFANDEFMRRVEDRIVRPTVEGLAAEKIDYRGFIFIGLMNVEGEPFVIEYNARMGDPETEVVFPRIVSDVVDLFEGIVCGTLDKYELAVSPLWATTVMCVSGGYPGDYKKGFPIGGLSEGGEIEGGSIVFHAGTRRKGGEVVTAGGRVLSVTSLGETMDEALAASFAAIGRISFEGIYFRRDIGDDLK
ncbi:MAG: phosphoribosylamine--glycine ligase [Alistipes sp.]|jgi:phosphoribosylamine--glycine ligase|nr:phosphoribosylamine--glycine ligase [Alistipes sp.]